MPITLPTPPVAPILGAADFDAKAGAFLAWMKTLTDTWNASPPLISGDFGMGGSPPQLSTAGAADAVTSYNTHAISQANMSLVGGPAGASSSILVTRGYTPVSAHQTLLEVGGAYNVYQRSYASGTWSSWRLVYNQNNILGTVSQSGGVPTGSVIQRGSNASGDFVRFADGTQICTYSEVPSASVDTTWTFPAAFSTITGLSPIGSSRSTANATFVGFKGAPTTTTATYNHWTTAGARTATSVSLLAIGRWY